MNARLGTLAPRADAAPASVHDGAAAFAWPHAPADDLLAGRLGLPDEELVPLIDATARQCTAVRTPEGNGLILLVNPEDASLHRWLQHRLMRHPRQSVRWLAVDAAALQAHLQQREQSTRVSGSLQSTSTEDDERPVLLIDPGAWAAEDDPVVRLLNATLYDALNARASDLHLTCDPQGLAIHYRLDGVLVAIGRIDGRAAAQQAISRIKVLSDLDIAERRLPQDGRLALSTGRRNVDMRVSIMPGIHGEDAVLRVLDRRQVTGEDGRLTLESLGMQGTECVFAREVASLPYGLFLVTGPTGSGKTTTLYAVLSETHHGTDKVITIEDPVEYELPGVLQIPVNEAKGLTFARGLRSVLRHDPDRIMVGEIRDAETAQIAVQAALTGHQVYATVHANNAVDVIGRLVSMGVDPYNLGAALNGVLAQRLVRLSCRNCQAAGCVACRGTGYSGRQAVVETVRFDESLRELVATRAPLSQVRTAARTAGSRSLRAAALDLLSRGLTTMAEVDRVTMAEEVGE